MSLPTRITLPPSGRTPGGLLDAGRPTGVGDWWRGVTFSSGQCLAPQVVGSCTDGEVSKVPQSLSETAAFDSFSVVQAIECSTMGQSGLEDFARQSLDVTREFGVASEFLTGAASGNPSLADADVLVASPADVIAALGCLDQAAGLALSGRTAFIHMAPVIATAAFAAGAIYKDGRTWYTPSGAIVVISPAYDGREPGAAGAPAAGAELFLYATGQVYTEVGMPEMLTAVERSQNTFHAIAEDAAIVVFDPCFNIAIDSGLVACEAVS